MEGLTMKLLEEKIVNDGVIKSGNVLKVDSFLIIRLMCRLLRSLVKN